MDIKVRNKVAELQQSLDQEELRISLADPIAKMMLVALAYQSCEIEHRIDETSAKLAKRFSEEILLHSNIQALPAVAIARICDGAGTMPYYVDENDSFVYKVNKCIYRPIFRTKILPGKIAACFRNNTIVFPDGATLKATWPDARHKDEIWIAYEAYGEVTSIEDVTVALSFPLPSCGLVAEVGDVSVPLSLLMEETPRTLNSSFMLLEFWRKSLVKRNFWIYKFGECPDKRVLHRSEIPAWILDSYSSEILEPFVGREYLWIRIKADEDCCLPDNVAVDFNFLPIVNYDIQNVKLSSAEPIQSLENYKTGTFFLEKTQNIENAHDFFIRDFDVTQYDNERIREDVTNLYNHYVNDYFAFVDSNALHEGAILRSLRQSMTQVYDSLGENRTGTLRPYGGVYAIRNPRNNNQPIVLTYFTTNGERGNSLKLGSKLTSSRAVVGEILVIAEAFGGRDKIRDTRTKNELARYHANSCDRIYTRIDLKQYCEVEFMRSFGEDALRYCNITLTDGNISVKNHIEKCITIKFNFNSDNLREQVHNSDFFKYLEINIELRKSFSWKIIFK